MEEDRLEMHARQERQESAASSRKEEAAREEREREKAHNLMIEEREKVAQHAEVIPPYLRLIDFAYH